MHSCRYVDLMALLNLLIPLHFANGLDSPRLFHHLHSVVYLSPGQGQEGIGYLEEVRDIFIGCFKAMLRETVWRNARD